jgi:ribonuclease HII
MLSPYFNAEGFEAGCDEAGRGCLAGAVVAAAVILPPDFYHKLLNDSKQMSEKSRDLLRPIIEKEAIAFAIAHATPAEIDQINILQASFLAMHRAIAQLSVAPTRLLIDGNRFKPFPKMPHHCVVKGDSKFASIAAASVLAKTERDDLMKKLHMEYPVYQWVENKGYPTTAHRNAIQQYGSTEHHRKSFRLLPDLEPHILQKQRYFQLQIF